MRTIDFDVNLINKIHFRPSYHDTAYVWKADLTKPKYKRFLLFFKVKDGVETKPAGFYEERTSHYDFYADKKYYIHISEEYLIESGYLIKEFGNLQCYRKEAWKKAYVEVDLGYRSAISRRFNTDIDAKSWIEYLKAWSNKQFETIEIEYEN